MSKPKLLLSSRKAKPTESEDAWWYENKGHIEIYVQVHINRRIGGARITRRQIESWLKKLGKK